MKSSLRFLALTVCAALSLSASAHHSFGLFDFETQIPFEGIVESLKFRNPHIQMTLKSMDADGKEQLIHFIEGAPANMLVRSGLHPEMVAPGTHITATGSPLLDDSGKYYLRAIRLSSGDEYGGEAHGNEKYSPKERSFEEF